MNCLLLFAATLVAAEASPLASVAAGYHDLIGIPAARQLRVMEDVSSRILGGMPSQSTQNPFFKLVLPVWYHFNFVYFRQWHPGESKKE